MAVSNDDLKKWAGFTPPPPVGTAVTRTMVTRTVSMGDETTQVTEWIETLAVAEPAPKLCPRCKAILTDGTCLVNRRHTSRPKVRKRAELDSPEGSPFGTDAGEIMRRDTRAPKRPMTVVEVGRTVKLPHMPEPEFAPPPLSGKVQHFTPLPGPVRNPVPVTSAQAQALKVAAELAGPVTRRDKSANVARVTRDRVGKAHRVKSCDTCHSAMINGECTLAAWHGKL